MPVRTHVAASCCNGHMVPIIICIILFASAIAHNTACERPCFGDWGDWGDWGPAAARLRQLRSAGSLADNARQPTDVQAGLLLCHFQGVTACAAMKAAAAVRACYRDVVSPSPIRCVGRAAFLEQISEAVHAVDQHTRPALQLQLVGPTIGELDSEPVTVAGVPVQLDAVTGFLVAAVAVAPRDARVARIMGVVAVGATSITGVVPTRSRFNPARHRAAAHNHGAAGGSVCRVVVVERGRRLGHLQVPAAQPLTRCAAAAELDYVVSGLGRGVDEARRVAGAGVVIEEAVVRRPEERGAGRWVRWSICTLAGSRDPVAVRVPDVSDPRDTAASMSAGAGRFSTPLNLGMSYRPCPIRRSLPALTKRDNAWSTASRLPRPRKSLGVHAHAPGPRSATPLVILSATDAMSDLLSCHATSRVCQKYV